MKYTKENYLSEVPVNEAKLQDKFQDIWVRVHQLGLQFKFVNLGMCNLILVREFYDNWNPLEDPEEVVVWGMVVPFCDEFLFLLLWAFVVPIHFLRLMHTHYTRRFSTLYVGYSRLRDICRRMII